MISSQLRLALDVAPVRTHPAGVGMYAASLARALARCAPDQLALVGLRDDAWALDDISARVAKVPFHLASPVARRAPNYHAWLQLHADQDAQQTRATIAHYTNAAAPLRTRVPFVLTVHDLSVLRLPRLHPLARVATAPVVLAAIARAERIIVPSNWVRGELARLRVSRRRVVMIEHAKSEAMPAAGSGDVIAELGLTHGEYLLAIGTIEPRKNLERLIAAWEDLAAADQRLRLVLCGASGWRTGLIERRIAASPWHERIAVAGYVRHSEVGALVRSAVAVCYVSTYEGFGMPIIEAMALGAPVVTSNRTSMPQAAGGAAVLVDPFDVSDITRGIREAITRREELSIAGRARVADRSWDDVAREHWAVYEWAHARR